MAPEGLHTLVLNLGLHSSLRLTQKVKNYQPEEEMLDDREDSL
jgi:hypothetical protein